MQKDMGYVEKKFIHAQRRGKKKKEKKKDISYLKKQIKDRVVQKECEFHLQKFHTHAHLDLIVWSVFSIVSDFWLSNMCGTSMLHFHPLPWAPQKSLLEGGRKERMQCLGEESYTFYDPWELFEEQSYNFFQKTQVIYEEK